MAGVLTNISPAYAGKIEMIYQDRIQKYWVRAVEGENPQSSNCSEETARSYIAQYHPIELNMKPFSEYPFS